MHELKSPKNKKVELEFNCFSDNAFHNCHLYNCTKIGNNKFCFINELK